jgi:ubiquinone/menaquinone biosynthesis C-methylase UbiE
MEPDIDRAEPRMIAEFADFRDGAVLEVGCGDGRLTGVLAALSPKVVAIDPDPERLAKAKAAVRGASFVPGIGERTGFRAGSFRAVVYTYSLHHVEPTAALTEARRILEPGGQLLVVEPAIEGEIMRYFELFKDEASELRRAKDGLAASDFDMERRESFRSRWSFRDREDLLDYYFKGAEARDPSIVSRIDALLGPKHDDAPIILADESWICSMRKPGKA